MARSVGAHEIRALVGRSTPKADTCLVGPDESDPLRQGSDEAESCSEGSSTPDPETAGQARRSFAIEGSGASDLGALGRARWSGMLLASVGSAAIVITADGPRPS